MPGSGTMSPGGSGGSQAPSIALPLPRTWLSLNRYAKIAGINPVHFWGAQGQYIWPLNDNRCNDIWPRHSWQAGSQVALEELAYAIKDAENAISDFVGYPLVPDFFSEEQHPYPHFYNKDFTSLGGSTESGNHRSVTTRWKKVVSPGKRATTIIQAAAAPIYTDEDGDGFYETATISVTTDVTPCEVKVYVTGTGANPDWEIREARSKVAAGGVVTVTMDSWLLIDPDLQAAHPTSDGFGAVDVTGTGNFLATVDVYREYIDTADSSAQFAWPCHEHCSTACTICNTTTQNGCLVTKNSENGFVVPMPASYDSGWTVSSWSLNESPEYVKIWYVAGDRSEDYLAGRSCDPLSNFWAIQIARLATARLYKPFCSCANVSAWAKELQVELTRQGEAGGHLFDFTAIANPFGTRNGEFMVYKTLALGGGKRRKIVGGAVR